MPPAYPRIAVIHHLQQPFLGNAAEPLGAVDEHFGGALPDLDAVDGDRLLRRREVRLGAGSSSPRWS